MKTKTLEDGSEDTDNTDAEDETETTPRRAKTKSAQDDYEARFKGLQGTLQQRTEELQALRQQMMVNDYNNFNTSIAQLDPAQQQALQQVWMLDAASKYRLSQAQDTEQRLQDAAKQLYVQQMATQYGVPARLLQRYDSPEEIEHTAKAIAAERKRGQTTTKKKVKAASGTQPKFGSGGSGETKQRQAAGSLDEAAARFAKAKI
jgi:hypothetical protein